MAELDEVLALAIEDYDPEAFYDGEEQIVKESVTELYGCIAFPTDYSPEQILSEYHDTFLGWYDSFEAMADDNIFDTWESEGYYFRSV
jgi:hypothetical protein